MKKRKILLLIPAFGLLLSGCTFQEGFATAKHWVGQNIYHPLKDWIKGLIGGGGEDKPTPEPGPSVEQYTVSFDANGGTGSMAAVTDVTGEYTLPACTFTAPEGKVFNGWKVGAEGEVKNAGDKITVSANITLYAQWRETTGEKYTVTFNVQGHGVAPASQSIDDGGKVTKPTDPTADGYTFGGWFKEAGCTNPWNFDVDVVSAATTLYAKWTENGGGETTDYGTLDKPISVTAADTILAAELVNNDDFTKQELFVKGVVKSVDKSGVYEDDPNPWYELHVQDESDSSKVVYVYRTHSAPELKESVVVGATIKFHGFAKNYQGTKEFVDTKTNQCTLYEAVAPSGEDKVTGVTFDKDNYDVYVGGSVKVSATVEPVTAGNKKVSYELMNVSPQGAVSINGDTITGVALGTATVKVTTDDGGFTDTATVTVKQASTNQIVDAYNAALALDETVTETDEYTFTGVVVGKRQSKEFFIQSEGVGIEYFATNNDFAVGKEVKVVSTLQKYYGLPETKTIKSSEVISETGVMPTPVEIKSVADLEAAKLNILANVTGTVVKDASDYVATSDYSLMINTTDGELKVFIKKDTFSSRASEIQALKKDDEVVLSNLITSVRNDDHQALFCLDSTIKVATPEKEIVSFGEVTGPASIKQGDPLSLDSVNIAVTYSDQTPGSVHPTAFVDFDNETVTSDVEVSVKYGDDVVGSFHLAITEKGSEVTLTKTVESLASENAWENGEIYSSFDLDSNISVTATGGTYTAKYYTNGNNWRIYQTDKGVATITAKTGTILSITITYTVDNNGVMVVGGNDVLSNTECEVNASSVQISARTKTSGKSNGQIRITEFKIVYTA